MQDNFTKVEKLWKIRQRAFERYFNLSQCESKHHLRGRKTLLRNLYFIKSIAESSTARFIYVKSRLFHAKYILETQSKWTSFVLENERASFFSPSTRSLSICPLKRSSPKANWLSSSKSTFITDELKHWIRAIFIALSAVWFTQLEITGSVLNVTVGYQIIDAYKQTTKHDINHKQKNLYSKSYFFFVFNFCEGEKIVKLERREIKWKRARRKKLSNIKKKHQNHEWCMKMVWLRCIVKRFAVCALRHN